MNSVICKRRASLTTKKQLVPAGRRLAKKGGVSGSNGGVSKGDMEKLIAAASQTAPAQTIRIEQAPMQIVPNSAPPKK